MEAEARYARLKELAETIPDFDQGGHDSARWLGRFVAILENEGNLGDVVAIKLAGDYLHTSLHKGSVRKIHNSIQRAIARAELEVPAGRGGFIAAGDVFEAIATLGKVIETAEKRVLIVDPYMNSQALREYAVFAREGVLIDLLAAEGRFKPDLQPSVLKWEQQYGDKRPVRLRIASPEQLHDRMMLIDDADAWDISQSLNALAARSAASITKSDPEQAALKVEAYAAIFDEAQDMARP